MANRYKNDKVIFNQIQTKVRIFHYKWNQRVSHYDLESEAMKWSAMHWDKLHSILEDSGITALSKYMDTSFKNLLSRYAQDIIVESTYFSAKEINYNSVESINNPNSVAAHTPIEVEYKLRQKNEKFLEYAEARCTPLQFQAVKARYYDGLTVKQAAVKLGVTGASIYRNSDRGIKNIVSKDSIVII